MVNLATIMANLATILSGRNAFFWKGGEVSDSEQTVGERLDLVRRREGLSQEAFAQLLGVSRSSLKYYIGDERDIPTSVLATLLEKLSVDPSWMISGDVSEAAMKQKTAILEQIREIGLAIELRATELSVKLTPDERWRLVSQIYTMAIVQNSEFPTQNVTSNFFLDTMFRNNGYG